jgi:hypothetical protein
MSKDNKKVKYAYPGTLLTSDRTDNFINRIHDSNLNLVTRMEERSKEGKTAEAKKAAVCIWGKHGIGKTALPEQIAKKRNIGFVKISPAQFEEMGDLMGMPSTGIHVMKDSQSRLIDKDSVDSYLNMGWIRDISKPSQAIMAPPEWVPNTDLGAPEEGFFVIDDFNRAGRRIINGIMDLLQNGGLASWNLPKKWTIILTANPTGGSYQITELDDAQMTRMTHLSMEFDEKMWAQWALKNDIDERVVNFIMVYPEHIHNGELTTPRSIEYFANNIKGIPDLKQDLGFVQELSSGSLDKEAAIAFTAFINNNLATLKSPKEILDSKDFKNEIEIGLVNKFSKITPQRVDVLSVLANRLIYYCASIDKLTDKQKENLKAFIKIESIPNDIRLSMAQELVSITHLKSIMSDPVIGKLLLKRM